MAVAVSSRSMIISWQPPIEEQRNGQIIEYNVNITLYKGTGESYMTTSVSTSVVVNSLHPNYVYQCFVASRTSAGLGPLNQVVLKLPPDGEGKPGDEHKLIPVILLNIPPLSPNTHSTHRSPSRH